MSEPPRLKVGTDDKVKEDFSLIEGSGCLGSWIVRVKDTISFDTRDWRALLS